MKACERDIFPGYLSCQNCIQKKLGVGPRCISTSSSPVGGEEAGLILLRALSKIKITALFIFSPLWFVMYPKWNVLNTKV